MKYINKTIEELHALLISKEVTPLELVKEAIEELKKDSTNAIETICEKEALEFASNLVEPEVDNLLWGIPYVCKDNFSTKDILTTGSSDILFEPAKLSCKSTNSPNCVTIVSLVSSFKSFNARVTESFATTRREVVIQPKLNFVYGL